MFTINEKMFASNKTATLKPLHQAEARTKKAVALYFVYLLALVLAPRKEKEGGC